MKYLLDCNSLGAIPFNRLNVLLNKQVTIDGVAVMTVSQLLSISNRHYIGEIDGASCQVFLDCDVKIQAIEDAGITILSENPSNYKNFISTSVQKLSKGKVYIIANTDLRYVNAVPNPMPLCYDTIVGVVASGDEINLAPSVLPFVQYIAYEDTALVNSSSSIDVIEMELDLNNVAINLQNKSQKRNRRTSQLQRF